MSPANIHELDLKVRAIIEILEEHGMVEDNDIEVKMAEIDQRDWSDN